MHLQIFTIETTGLLLSTFTNNAKDAYADPGKHIFEGDDGVKDIQFQENHKFSLFHILVAHWKQYLENNKNIEAFVPDSVKDRSKQYLQNSNELFSWFEENYRKVDDTVVVPISDVFEKFKYGNIFTNYTKAEIRELNKGKFIEKMSKNLFLRKNYRDREKRKAIQEIYNCKEMRNILVGFEEIEEE